MALDAAAMLAELDELDLEARGFMVGKVAGEPRPASGSSPLFRLVSVRLPEPRETQSAVDLASLAPTLLADLERRTTPLQRGEGPVTLSEIARAVTETAPEPTPNVVVSFTEWIG